MRFWYVSQKRERIFDHAALLLFLVVLIAVLLWLFPQQGFFRKQLPDGRVDAVSIAYLELLSRSAPQDRALSKNLVTQLMQTGQFERAWELLNRLQPSIKDSDDTELQLLQLEVLAQLTFAQHDQQQRAHYQRLAVEQMVAIQGLRLSANDRERLAAIALSLSRPLVAADQYVALADIRKLERPNWLRRAIKWYVAAERHATAAMLNETLAQHYSGKPRADLIANAVKIYRMLGRQDQALAVLERYLNQPSYEASMLISAADIAHETQNNDKVIAYLQRVLQERVQHKDDLKRVRELAMAMGDIALARDAAKAVNRLDPYDEQNLQQLAQLYEWNGQGHEALNSWLRLLELNPDEKTLAYTRRLAIALFEHETVITISEQIGRERALSNTELAALANAYSQHSRLDNAIAYLQAYVQRYPDDEHGWRTLARIAEYAEQFPIALQAWGVLQKDFAISTAEARNFAGIHWSFDDTAAAYAVLNAAKDKVADNDREFWAMYAQIAWQEGRHAEAVAALRLAVSDLSELDQIQSDIFLLLEDPALRDEQMQIAESAWQRFGKPQYLLRLMLLANAANDDVLLARALAEAEKQLPLFAQNPTYWLVKGDYEYRQSNVTAADKAYWSAVQLSAYRSDTLAAYLWFLINTAAHDKLAFHVAQWQNKALQDKTLFQPYAVAYAVLGDYDVALNWFQRLIDEFGPQYDVLLDYADVLSFAGLEPAAWRLRRYVYQSLQQAPDAFPANQQYRALQPVNRAVTVRLLRERQQHTAVDNWLPQYAQQVWRGDRLDEMNFWRAYYQRYHQRDLPFHQQVVLALHNQDKDHARALLAAGADMPASQRANLVELADSRTKAQAIRLAALSDARHQQEQLELRRDIVREVTVHESGSGISQTREEQGLLDSRKTEFVVKQAFDNVSVQATLATQEYESNGSLNLADIDKGQSLALQAARLNESGHWRISARFDQRDDADATGLATQWQRQLQSGLTLALSAQWNGLDDTTILSRALTRASYVQGDVEWHVTARDRVEFMLGARQFSDWRSGDAFADGSRGRLRYTHHVNYQRPSLYFSVAWDWQENSIDAVLPDALQQRLGQAGLGTGSLLPDSFSQVGLSATVQHGNPHALNADTPSPRYILSVGVAQRLRQSATVISLEAGVGIPILGNDELAIGYRYNSEPLGGVDDQDSHVFQLSYNYRFGR